MKQRDLYTDKINIDDTFSIQIDPKNKENLLIYENYTVIEEFSLRKRIFTLFKTLQELIEHQDYILLDQKTKLYAQEIPLKDNIFMKVSDNHACLTVDFYTKNNQNEIELLYLSKMTYMTQKLFNKMLIPEKILNDSKYRINNAIEFKDMLEVFSLTSA